jgi:hypothetical protein
VIILLHCSIHLLLLNFDHSPFLSYVQAISSYKDLKFQASEEGREGGEKEKALEGLSSEHKVHNKVGPTIRGMTRMGQVHISFSL